MADQAQAAPAGGMRRIPIPLESYQHASAPLSVKKLLNFYAEKQPGDARTAAALVSSPGLALFQVCGEGPIKAINSQMPGFIYVVSGSRFYRIVVPTTGLYIDDLGEIGVPSVAIDPAGIGVTLAVGSTAVVVVVPPNAFTCTHSGPLNQLGGTFPGDAGSVAYLDGYFAFTSTAQRQQFFVCSLLDPTNFDALDFASADAAPNALVAILAHRGEYWLMGASGVEVWYDSGTADFPFRRRPGAFIPQGCSSIHNLAQADSSVFWSGLSNIVFRSNGYSAQRISTHAIEGVIAAAGGSAAAISAMAYSQGGHTFYALTVPGRTLVYDCATEVWHERASGPGGTGQWRINTACVGTDLPFLGDTATGKIFYAMTPGWGTEDGTVMTRQVVLPPIWAGTNRAFCHRLEVEMEVGGTTTPGAVTLDWSDDGGFTWTGGPRLMSAGNVSERRRRVYATRLGSFRQRVFRLTMPGWATIYAVDADIVEGAS